MKAIVYTKYGSPAVLSVKEVARPEAKSDEVMIKVQAAEVTKADCELRSFKFPVKWFWLPLRLALGITRPRRQILGGYFAGEICALGKDVSKFKDGALVFGAAQLRMGAYGEYLCLPESYTIVPTPANISSEAAAAVPLGGLNALHFLRKEQMLRRIGADHFIDYAAEDFTKSNQKYDVVFDMVAGSSYAGCIRVLNPKGRYVTANPRLSKIVKCIITPMFSSKKAYFSFAGEKAEELLALKEMIESENIKPVVDRTYSMEQAADAHHRVETERRLGSVVISMKNVVAEPSLG